MDHKALSALLIKLAGAFIIINALTDFPRYFANVVSLGGNDLPLWILLAGGALPLLVPLLAGVGMFMFPGMITNRLIHTPAEQESLVQATPRLEAAAFSVLGGYLVFRAIADAAYLFSKFKLYEKVILQDPIYVGPNILPDEFASFVTTGIEFLMGVSLLLGAKGLVRLKDRIRGRE